MSGNPSVPDLLISPALDRLTLKPVATQDKPRHLALASIKDAQLRA